MPSDMLKKLDAYYKENGILSTSFTCEYKENCKSNCTSFTGPKSTFVSSGYEKNQLPRLLFLSLDSGSGEKIDEKRLSQAVREQEEDITKFENMKKNKHWYLTHELAWYILHKFDKNKIKDIKNTRNYFAHANSAKCCMNNKQRSKADARLFRNCKQYLQGELNILSPDIIITQGNEAREAISSLRNKTVESIDDYASVIKINNRPIFWLHTYHPNCFGKFYAQRRDFDKKNVRTKGWEKYSDLIYEFIKNKRI